MSVEELPAQCSGHAETAIVGGAAANTNQTASGSFVVDHAQKITQTFAVEFERVIFSRRELRQPDHASRFDNRRLRFWLPPPEGFARPVRGVDRFCALRDRSHQLADQFAEAIPAIAHRQHLDLIRRP